MESYATSVGRRKDVLIIGDDSCGAFLFHARMISPKRLPRGMGYAGNMPKRDIYFGFLHGGDTMETKSCRSVSDLGSFFQGPNLHWTHLLWDSLGLPLPWGLPR
jgi:hypothetical protein